MSADLWILVLFAIAGLLLLAGLFVLAGSGTRRRLARRIERAVGERGTPIAQVAAGGRAQIAGRVVGGTAGHPVECPFSARQAIWAEWTVQELRYRPGYRYGYSTWVDIVRESAGQPFYIEDDSRGRALVVPQRAMIALDSVEVTDGFRAQLASQRMRPLFDAFLSSHGLRGTTRALRCTERALVLGDQVIVTGHCRIEPGAPPVESYRGEPRGTELVFDGAELADEPLIIGPDAPRVLATLRFATRVGLVLVALAFGAAASAMGMIRMVEHREQRARIEPARLASIGLATTPDALASMLGVPVTGALYGQPYLDVDLHGQGPIPDRVRFYWDGRAAPHVRSVELFRRGIAGAPVQARLRQLLGRRFTGPSFSWIDTSLGLVHDQVDHLRIEAVGPAVEMRDETWKRLDALWDVVRVAALGLDVPVTEDKQRAWLGRGYPLASLARAVRDGLDPGDAGCDTAMKAFPGTGRSRLLACLIPLDHPWFHAVELDGLGGMSFTPWNDVPPPSVPGELEACLTRTFGTPTEGRWTVSTHLAKQAPRARSSAARMSISVEHKLVIQGSRGDDGNASLADAIDGVAACPPR